MTNIIKYKNITPFITNNNNNSNIDIENKLKLCNSRYTQLIEHILMNFNNIDKDIKFEYDFLSACYNNNINYITIDKNIYNINIIKNGLLILSSYNNSNMLNILLKKYIHIYDNILYEPLLYLYNIKNYEFVNNIIYHYFNTNDVIMINILSLVLDNNINLFNYIIYVYYQKNNINIINKELLYYTITNNNIKLYMKLYNRCIISNNNIHNILIYCCNMNYIELAKYIIDTQINFDIKKYLHIYLSILCHKGYTNMFILFNKYDYNAFYTIEKKLMPIIISKNYVNIIDYIICTFDIDITKYIDY